MTSKTAVKRAKAIARLPLDIPMAALAAASVAFVAFAMPDHVFAGAIGLTGLPSVLPAAQPPLGGTARAAVILAGAAATFGLVWLTLRALGKRPRPAAPELPDFDIAPRLRRADAHPDAPSRRPLFAGHDLGEPAQQSLDELELTDRLDDPEADADWDGDEAAPESDAELDADDEVAPMFRVPDIAAEPEPLPEPEAEAAPEAEPEAKPEPRPEPVTAEETVAEPEAPPAVPWPESPRIRIEMREEPKPASQEQEPEQPQIRVRNVSRAAELREDETSISGLMQRLERGLEQRSRPAAPPPSTPAAPAAAAVDSRLTSAIGDLRKLAGRGVSHPRPSAPRS